MVTHIEKRIQSVEKNLKTAVGSEKIFLLSFLTRLQSAADARSYKDGQLKDLTLKRGQAIPDEMIEKAPKLKLTPTKLIPALEAHAHNFVERNKNRHSFYPLFLNFIDKLSEITGKDHPYHYLLAKTDVNMRHFVKTWEQRYKTNPNLDTQMKGLISGQNNDPCIEIDGERYARLLLADDINVDSPYGQGMLNRIIAMLSIEDNKQDTYESIEAKYSDPPYLPSTFANCLFQVKLGWEGKSKRMLTLFVPAKSLEDMFNSAKQPLVEEKTQKATV
ncbi:MAG TPA: hypothetical protein VD999_00170 [Vitreimonas sp.]|nr:hypothetical protein [Vitreimonas sp.]